jgi:hypothetical protein
VFYFCGHGIMVGDHYLLAEDFGSNNLLPFEKAFDLSNTLRAVERESTGALFFFIDACRQVSKKLALTFGSTPTALMEVDLEKPLSRTSSTLIRATGDGTLAFGAENKVSRFTSALLTGMSGYCGIKAAGHATWDVDGESLASAVRKLLETGNKSARRQVSDQQISGVSVPLLRMPSAPFVKISIDLLPVAQRAFAKLYLTSAKGEVFEHDGANGVFVREVKRGIYDVGAKAQAAQFAELLHPEEELIPPVYELTMRAAI